MYEPVSSTASARISSRPGILDRILEMLKSVPLDLGQGNLREVTMGKKIALALVPEGTDRRALDVGAREGSQTRWLESLGYDVQPIDVAPVFEGCDRVDVDRGLPYGDESFDLIWCSEVIEHLEDPAGALAEFRRVLRPGGEAILTTPNSYALLFRFLALFGLTPRRLQRKDHRHFFSRRDIEELAPRADVYGFFPYLIVKRKIQRAVGALSPTFVLRVRKD